MRDWPSRRLKNTIALLVSLVKIAKDAGVGHETRVLHSVHRFLRACMVGLSKSSLCQRTP